VPQRYIVLPERPAQQNDARGRRLLLSRLLIVCAGDNRRQLFDLRRQEIRFRLEDDEAVRALNVRQMGGRPAHPQIEPAAETRCRHDLERLVAGATDRAGPLDGGKRRRKGLRRNNHQSGENPDSPVHRPLRCLAKEFSGRLRRQFERIPADSCLGNAIPDTVLSVVSQFEIQPD